MKKIALFSVLALALMVGMAWAQPPEDGPSAPPPWCWRADDLKLTQDQQNKLYELEKKHIAEAGKIRTDIELKMLEMRTLFVSEKPDAKKIDKLENEIRDLQEKLYDLSKSYRDKARALLTKEQLDANPLAFYGGKGRGAGYGMGCGMGFGPGCGRDFDDHPKKGRGWWKGR